MRNPITSIKHYVQFTNQTVAANIIVNRELIQSVPQTAVANQSDVVEGSVVNAVFLEFWLLGQGATGVDTQFNAAIYKNPSDRALMTAGEITNLMAYTNKKNVLYFTQGVIGDKFTNSIPVFRGWIKIPKGKQRFGLGDEFIFAFESIGEACQLCGFATYKEFK